MPLKRRNLEKTDRDISAGPWRISSLADPITEKRYLLFALRLRGPRGFFPARRRVPHRSRPADRGEPLSRPGVDDRRERPGRDSHAVGRDRRARPPRGNRRGRARRCGSSHARFSSRSTAFFASDLFPETIARDDSGRWILLPAAYAIPIRGDTRSAGSAVDGGFARALRFERVSVPGGRRPRRSSREARRRVRLQASSDVHGGGGAGVLRRFASVSPGRRSRSRAARSSRPRRCTNASSTRRSRRHFSPSAARAAARGRRPRRGACSSASSGSSTGPPEEGSVTVLEGASRSGKTRVIGEIGEAPPRKGRIRGFRSRRMGPLRETALARSGAGTGRGSRADPRRNAVWIIDDIDEKNLGELGVLAIDDRIRFVSPRRGGVSASQPAGASKETSKFLAELKTRPALRRSLGRKNGDFDRLGRRIGVGIRPSQGGHRPGSRGAHRRGATASRVRRRGAILDYRSTWCSPSSPSANTGSRSPRSGSARSDLIEEWYRPTRPKSGYTLFFRMRSGGTRRLVYDRLSPARRKTLHRTLALAAEETGHFPAYFLLFHALRAGDAALAARHLVKYLKETTSEKRDPFVDHALPGARRRKGRRDASVRRSRSRVLRAQPGPFQERERRPKRRSLLLSCEELMENAEIDQKLKSASLLASSLRLLADWWETTRRVQTRARAPRLGEVRAPVGPLHSRPGAASQRHRVAPVPARRLRRDRWSRAV